MSEIRKRHGADAIQVITMKVSKGLELPVVALLGAGHMPAAGEDEQEDARVLYVAATRATHRLVMGVGGGQADLGTGWLYESDQPRNQNKSLYSAISNLTCAAIRSSSS